MSLFEAVGDKIAALIRRRIESNSEQSGKVCKVLQFTYQDSLGVEFDTLSDQ